MTVKNFVLLTFELEHSYVNECDIMSYIIHMDVFFCLLLFLVWHNWPGVGSKEGSYRMCESPTTQWRQCGHSWHGKDINHSVI